MKNTIGSQLELSKNILLGQIIVLCIRYQVTERYRIQDYQVNEGRIEQNLLEQVAYSSILHILLANINIVITENIIVMSYT